MTLPLVEQTSYVDIQDFKELKKGEYKGTIKGFRGALVVEDGKYILGTQTLKTAITKVGYGHREWFVCPLCSGNTKRLYFLELAPIWKCRECHNLIYKKSRLSGNEFKYVTHRIRELQEELEVSKDNNWPSLGLTDCDIEWLPMFKPKNMHWETFVRKRELLEFLIMKRVQLWLAMVK